MKIVNIIAVILVLSIVLFISRDSQVQIKKTKLTPTIFLSPTPHVFDAEKLWRIVNDYRLSKNLQPFIKNDELCDIAIIRARESYIEITPHEKFLTRYSNYPYKISENATGATSEDDALQRWINSIEHKKALDGSWKYSCVACYVNLNCVQIFSSFDNINHNAVN